jgi:uridine kinase
MRIIGIAGGSGSGKTSLVRRFLENDMGLDVKVISQDHYYKDNSHLSMDERKKLNFDHPNSLDFSLLKEHIDKLMDGKEIDVPRYSFLTCTRDSKTDRLVPPQILIVEGILIYYEYELREKFDLKVFIHLSRADRLERIIERDTSERGRTKLEVMMRFDETVDPMHIKYVERSASYADIAVDGTNLRKNTNSIFNTIINDKRIQPL